MLNIDEINNTIEQLESGATTYDNCIKLSALYNVKEHIENGLKGQINESETVLKEYDDILPQYKSYCDIKRKYQLHETTEQAVEVSIKDVCKEINEFIHTLYNNTDMQIERDCIKQMTKEIGVF